MPKAYVYVALLIAVLVFVKWYDGARFDAGYNKAVSEYEIRLRNEREQHAKALAEQEQAASNIAAAWLSAKPQKEVRYVSIIKEVPVYVENNPVCDLSRGAVGLLNNAADPERLPDDPALTKAEAGETSSITQPAQIAHCIGWAKQYNELSDQMNALIDATEKQEGE